MIIPMDFLSSDVGLWMDSLVVLLLEILVVFTVCTPYIKNVHNIEVGGIYWQATSSQSTAQLLGSVVAGGK